MAAELSILIPEFRKKLIEAITACKARKVRIEVLKTIVTPTEQASLWQQGRTKTDAGLKILALENANAPYLADCFRRSQPQETKLVTDQLPGFSWHQWGEAASVIWVDGTGRLNWSNTKICEAINGYHVLAEEAEKLGLVSASRYGDGFNEWSTVQFRPFKSPGDMYPIVEIDTEMKKRFGTGR